MWAGKIKSADHRLCEWEDEALIILEGYCQNLLATFRANDNNINVRNEWGTYVGQQPIFF